VLSGRALKLTFAVFMVLVAIPFVRRYLGARKGAVDDREKDR
jgi:hypothetical protein